MPRQPRIDAPGFLYHIIARGIDRRRIFLDDDDRQFFLARLGKLVLETGTPCYAFALIPNHFHLLLRRDQIPISRFVQRLLTAYAGYLNRKHRRRGHLFQNRYKSIICEEDTYFLELVRYINLNPLRAGLVESLDALTGYPYCSHSYMMGQRSVPWFEPAPVLGWFGGEPEVSRVAYRHFITAAEAGSIRDLAGGGLKRSLGLPLDYSGQHHAFDSRVLGLGEFVERLVSSTGDSGDKKTAAEWEQACIDACRLSSLTKAELRSGRSRQACKARAALAVRLSREFGLSNSEIARQLAVSQAAVHKMLKREASTGFDSVGSSE